MIAERDENYRLICAKRGTHWWVEVRAGAWWAVGSPSPDLLEAIENAKNRFAADNPQVRIVFDAIRAPDSIINAAHQLPASTEQSETDLSDLFQ
ncbi:hypothetical protein RCIROH_55 [Rhodobacter phage RcIroh]|nr:hypothetical protein RCIROH_55 [Rhodobacter phage RcIroh]